MSNKRSAWEGFRSTHWGVQLLCWILFPPAPALAWAWQRGTWRYGVAAVGTVVYIAVVFTTASEEAKDTRSVVPLPTTTAKVTQVEVETNETGSESLDQDSTTSTTPSTTRVETTTTSTAPPPPPPTTPGSQDVFASLAALSIRDELPMTGYSRDLFPHWLDADSNRCHTRCEVLLREALPSGGWLSAYDNVMVYDASDLDIDHVVPLAEAWRSGASTWETDRRALFANDLDEPWALKAVTASTNRSKSDSDPADWRPPNRDIWCDYAKGWIAVKLKWDLSADNRERDALGQMLETC